MNLRVLYGIAAMTIFCDCYANGDDYAAFNFKKCEHWQIEDAGWWPDQLPQYERYDPKPDQPPQTYIWSNFVAKRIDAPGGTKIRTSSLCKLQYKGDEVGWEYYIPIYCKVKPGFPFSGVTFKPASKSDLFNFRCKSGCTDAVPPVLHKPPGEVRRNKKLEQAQTAYWKKCGSEPR